MPGRGLQVACWRGFHCSHTMKYHQRAAATPRRAIMYVPGYDDRKANKAATLTIDSIVLDCEDGVAINKKEEARVNIPKLLARTDFGSKDRFIRVNSRDTGLTEDDVSSILASNNLPDGLLLPKVNSVDDINWFCDLAARNGNLKSLNRPMILGVMVETAIAMLNLKEITSFKSNTFDLQCLIFGADDFLAEIGASKTENAMELMYARQHVILHAKAFGLQAIDMVYNNYKDLIGLQRQAIEGAKMGFTGKQVIHPGQIDIVQESFSPSKEQIEWAKALSIAFEDHQQQGKGAFIFRGQMIDKPLLLQANNILSLINNVNGSHTSS
ncbi:uncharacterized protein TRIADDRAFT_26921 [Trichoplax adhaerens]|uniref:Citramalyl-CoA lyase, mitochondrial n=1 Tax=Trichoplax adhaerens TaxID=10228 RepID=B3RZI7_TRIAD|nr:hypothetical protein TRIADDRAFT_26921 [Trichoplax adhaerens]EDV23849.1 hypothetical protein TRIADDRAFT_26921 [Trichoplax adhaerens]|eukprot:XP_002113375.1 hypothetical protein TRIADDRAFT_26921 [Trichoplax adhaerens]